MRQAALYLKKPNSKKGKVLGHGTYTKEEVIKKFGSVESYVGFIRREGYLRKKEVEDALRDLRFERGLEEKKALWNKNKAEVYPKTAR